MLRPSGAGRELCGRELAHGGDTCVFAAIVGADLFLVPPDGTVTCDRACRSGCHLDVGGVEVADGASARAFRAAGHGVVKFEAVTYSVYSVAATSPVVVLARIT